jgi:cyclophilin family peptidyl-prolyl cis-trans isomerase
VVQGGDPSGNGTGGGQMPSEFNKLEFKVGAVGIARGQDPRINNDAQFFIVKRDSPHLNGQYTNFGQVTVGLDLVVKIAIGDKIKKITVK